MASPAPVAGNGDLYKNLEPLEDTQIALFEVDPNADFGVYKRVKLLDTFVALRSGWERDQTRSASRMRISKNEVERIKTDVARGLFTAWAQVLRDFLDKHHINED